MNAQSGEIIAMASHPTYDPNALDAIGPDLMVDASRPLVNRATQGLYLQHNAVVPMLTAGSLSPGFDTTTEILDMLGLYSPPQIRLPVSASPGGTAADRLHVSPLQMAVAAATLSNHGVRPAPRIALAVNTPREGWVVLPALGDDVAVFSAEAADKASLHYASKGSALWSWRVTGASSRQVITWYLSGTLPDWRGTPLVSVVLLESSDLASATAIGNQLLQAAGSPRP